MRRLSWPLAILLGLLAAPRVILHDLDAIDGGTFVNFVLAVGPAVIWLIVLIKLRTPEPIKDGLRLGVVNALVLILVHQALWTRAYDDDPPRLGDRLADVPDIVHDVVTRGAAGISSLVIGLVIGLIVGVLAMVALRLRGGDGSPSW